MPIIDTHAHIHFQAFKNDREEVIKRCKNKGMVLNLVGTQKDTSRDAVELAEKYDWMYASIATHPIHLHSTHVDEEETSFQSREEGFDEEYYEELVKSKKVIGVGETGLDLYHLPGGVPVEEVLAKQTEVFLAHFRFAKKHNKTLVIHCRDAHDQMIELLKKEELTVPSVIHCFTSGWEHAKQYLRMGFYLGFTGVVTFPPKKNKPEEQEKLLEVMEKISLDRIVVETDSPYLAPQKYRGKRCEPWMVEEVIEKFAKIRGKSYEEMEDIIYKNTLKLFPHIQSKKNIDG